MKKKCFVVCPIGADESDVRKNSDSLLKHIIKPICESCEFEVVRVDQINKSDSITNTILESLETNELVIVDVTGHNPNVFYEMGYRARTKKPMILLRKKGENLPFDINTIRAFDYDLTDLDSVETIKERLKSTIESFNYKNNGEGSENVEPLQQTIMPILYQILDAMGDLKKDIKSISSDTIGTVIKSMQSNQPQVSSETALQMQLINGLLQNPDGFAKILSLSEKLNNK